MVEIGNFHDKNLLLAISPPLDIDFTRMESTLYPSAQLAVYEEDRSKCRYGGNCYNSSTKHRESYRHPAFCPHNGYCRNMSDGHLCEYHHVPLCKYALQCYKREIPDHALQYRHCNRTCLHGGFCIKFHDTFHLETFSHPFLTPCPWTPYSCPQHDEVIRNHSRISNDALLHCYRFAHVCPLGRQCPYSNEEHIQTSIHIARKFCPDGVNCCDLINEEHLSSYSHINLLDVRQSCIDGTFCLRKQDSMHVTQFRHEDTCHFSIAPYFGFHKDTDYVQNQCQMLSTVKNFMVSQGSQDTFIPENIINFIRVIQPMHRCKRSVFESILRQGHLMSSEYMELLKEATRVADQVWTQVQGEVQVHKNHELEQTVREFILTLIQNEFEIVAKHLTDDVDGGICSGTQFCENKLNSSALSKEQISSIRECAVTVAKASLDLYEKRPGIHHGADKYFGTDKHVFGILGPNLGHRYGDILILFRRQVMLHPDANFAIQAATTFHSERAYRWRPWLSNPVTLDLRIEDFHNNVLHCSVPGYEYAAAFELLAVTATELGITPHDLSLDQVIEQWMAADPHQRFEAHLPALIPLDYIDHVYMPKSLFESLSPWAQKQANEVFGSLLTVTPHEVSPDDSIKRKIDDMRKTYQDFVLSKVVNQYVQMAENTYNLEKERTQQGFVTTLPASKLEAFVLIPFRISQSRMLSTAGNSDASFHPSTFIYWQALGGDMMIVLTNKPIRTDQLQSDLHTLTCYIATSGNVLINEEYSYISDAPFYSHYTTENPQNAYEVSSNTFHRGCNSQGYATYCLHIEFSTGLVTLCHAGPNSIYNHDKLTYQITRRNLDLSILDCVQLSAGKKAVPIRNFIITHESIRQLHPLCY